MNKAEQKLESYVADRKPLLYVSEGRINYICNLVIIKDYTFRSGLKAEGIGIGLDRWYMPTNYGVRAVRFLQNDLKSGSDDFIWDIGNIEIRRTLPEYGEDFETNRWNAHCKRNISNDFFKELQTTLLEGIASDYEMVKKEGA